MSQFEPAVWKFPLEWNFEMQLLKLPKPARILSATLDPKTDLPCVYAEVDPEPDAEMQSRIVQYVFTGHRAPLDARFLNTVVDSDGLIYHVYEVNG